MKNIILGVIASVSLLSAQSVVFDQNSSEVNGIYNYKYSPNIELNNTKTNIFVDGNFKKVHRYDALYMSWGSLSDSSEITLDAITKQIHKYTDDNSSEIVVSVIGYTQKVENKNQEVELDSGYTNFFQSLGKRDNLDAEDASEENLENIEIVYSKILDNNVSKELIYKENRTGKDALYSEEFSEGRDLNNRVDVAIYVKAVLDPSSQVKVKKKMEVKPRIRKMDN